MKKYDVSERGLAELREKAYNGKLKEEKVSNG